jgi:hypothetical protein
MGFGIDKCLRILKGVVAFHFRAGNLAGVQRFAVFDRDHPHGIDGYLKHLCRRHGKYGRVNPVGSRRYDGDLRAPLSTTLQKGASILKRFAFDPFAEHSSFGQRDSAARFNHSNRVLRDD